MDPKVGKSLSELKDEEDVYSRTQQLRKVDILTNKQKYNPEIPLDQQLIYQESVKSSTVYTRDVDALRMVYETKTTFEIIVIHEYLVYVNYITRSLSDSNNNPNFLTNFYNVTFEQINDWGKTMNSFTEIHVTLAEVKKRLDGYHFKELPLAQTSCIIL